MNYLCIIFTICRWHLGLRTLELHLWTPLGDFRPHTPNLPTPGKNPAGVHGECFVIIRLCTVVLICLFVVALVWLPEELR